MKFIKEHCFWKTNSFPLFTFAFIAAMLSSTTISWAQQEPLVSNYTQNILSFNPAFAGAKKSTVISALYNKQFTALESGTIQQNFSIHSPINYNRIGIGASVYSIKQDIFSASFLSGSMSYKIKLRKGYLSGGLSIGMYQVKINRYNLQIQNPEDPTLNSNTTFATHPDLNSGLFYTSDKFSIGLSVQHMIKGLGKTDNGIELNKHYYLIMSKNLNLTHNSGIQLANKTRYTSGATLQADLSAYYLFKDLCKAGVSYRTIGALSFQLSMALKTFIPDFSHAVYFSYAYDHSLKGYQVYTKGSHEFMLVMELFSLKKPGNDKPVISPLMF